MFFGRACRNILVCFLFKLNWKLKTENKCEACLCSQMQCELINCYMCTSDYLIYGEWIWYDWFDSLRLFTLLTNPSNASFCRIKFSQPFDLRISIRGVVRPMTCKRPRVCTAAARHGTYSRESWWLMNCAMLFNKFMKITVYMFQNKLNKNQVVTESDHSSFCDR